MKFSSYLEYFVLPTAKRSKTPPAYYELLMKQVSPFLDRVDVEHSSGTGKISFAQEAKANRLNEVESTEEANEEAMNLLDRVDAEFKQSGPNARSIANYVYLGAYDVKSRQEFSIVDEATGVAMDKAIAHIRDVIDQEKGHALQAAGRGKLAKRPRPNLKNGRKFYINSLNHW